MSRLPLDTTTAKLAVNRATYLLRDHAVLRGTARSPAFQSSVHQPPLCIEEHWRATKKWVPSCSSPALLFPRRLLLDGPFDSSHQGTSSDGLVTFPPSDPKSPERTDPGPIRPPSFDGLSG